MKYVSLFGVKFIALTAVFAGVGVGAVTPQLAPEQVQFFESKIRPILANHCLECHSADKGKVKGGLNLDSREDLMIGGENGPVLKPGSVSESSLIKAVEWIDDLQMPPKKKLTDEQIVALKEWIGMGAPDPREKTGAQRLTKKDHWAFQPVSRPVAPSVKGSAWCKTSIDKFVLAKLEEKQMLPSESPETGSDEDRRRKKEALLRRAYFDLVGMPPSPQQIRDYTNDPASNAFEKVVDSLLASPAYGERWARHWMDTARYADTTGTVGNDLRADYRFAYAWGYRDWLINAINGDMPYDQFVLNQLAADKVPGNAKANLAALGFLTVGQRFKDQDDVINDRIDVVGRGFLGLTLACARCHDHKFDPIKQSDYYALRGIFASSIEPRENPIIAEDSGSKEYQEFQTKLQTLEKRAFAMMFQMQREASEKLRGNAAAYFEASYLFRQRSDIEAQKRSQGVLEKNKLDGVFISNYLQRHATPRDSIWGPFVRLFTTTENRNEALAAMLAGEKREKYNPVVLEFLRNAGTLPNDIETVSALFEKFCREKLDPVVGAKVESKTDPVKDLEKAGIYRRLADPTTDVANSPEKPLMELAVFPFNLIAGAEMNIPRLRDVTAAWGVVLGSELENRSGLSRINELILTSPGAPIRAMVLEDLPKPVDSPIYPRGNIPQKGDNVKIVPRRFIEVLSEGGTPVPFTEGSGRYELARAIANKSNPLTARVMVNRIWMYHFGEGLVRTPDDLGNQAGAASHPELLDFLTSWFTDDYGPSKPAWSVKALHKAIMLSSVYQQSSRSAHLQRQQEMDASNSLLWRANMRRLDFDSFRDSLLSMAATLNPQMYGPPVNLVSEPYSFRRSVYGYIDRGNMPDLLMQFDMVNSVEPNTKRTSTIVPQQALFLMNSPFAIAVAQNVVKRPEVVKAVVTNKDTRGGIIEIFRIVLQRTPSKVEYEMAVRFLQAQAKSQTNVVAETTELASKAMKRAQNQLVMSMGREDKTKALLNEGELVKRGALSPWETLVQALMFCNEAAYLN